MRYQILCSRMKSWAMLAVLLFTIGTGSVAQNNPRPVPGTAESLSQNRESAASSVLAVGLQQFYSSTGKYTLSADGKGSTSSSMTIRVNKPNAAATVEKAILISAVTSSTIANGCVTISGVPVNWAGSATSSGTVKFSNYWADVTSIVAAQINGFPAGISTLNLTECNGGIDGEALLVVFNDATATEKTIIVMIGAQNPSGDNFSVTLSQPIDPAQPGALLDMGLGIGFSFQGNGTQQSSRVSVNTQRITSSAGGEDDGQQANGALITVGGIGDLNTNPADPFANPTTARSDDELYSILPFINNTTTSLNINTINPSLDDNIFLAYFALSGAAIIGEGILLSQTTSSGNVGTNHTVKAAVLNSLGQPVPDRLVTFTITSGPNAGGTFATNTNASGEAFYTYTGSGGAGIDNIQACFTNSLSVQSCSNIISFQWLTATVSDLYYSKATGDLHNVLTWGLNPDGSGPNPPDFGVGKTFQLANRPGIYTMTADWAVGGTINVPAASQLQINGSTLSIASLAGPGTLSGSLTSNLNVGGAAGGIIGLNFTGSNSMLNNLTVNRTGSGAAATIGTPLSLFNALTLTNGTLNTGNFLTLKSNVSTTARVAPVTGAISGNLIVERYIPARRAWRILSAPVGGTQTINQGWQEGAILGLSANPNPVPGYGTHITGGSIFGSTANGFDQNPGSASSIKMYNNTTNNWQVLQNTTTNIIGAAAYMTFVRGERGLPIGLNTVPPTITTLRATGPLKVGDQVFPVSGTGFSAIPNPFASPINFATITRSGVQNNFYLWDPKMGGLFGVGAYVLLSDNGAGGYDIVPAPVSPESQYIQSGQGFLVRPSTAGVSGILTIKESDKSATAATDVFRINGNSNVSVTNAPKFEDPKNGQGLRINLQVVNADRTTSVLDEVFSSYKTVYSDKIDALDAVKLDNIEENLAIVRERQTFMVERKGLPKQSDIIELKLWNTAQKAYMLEFNPVNLSGAGFPALLEDKYLKTFTPVSLSEKSQVYFTITSDAASARTDRFRIVLGKQTRGALTSLSVKNMITAYPNPINGRSLSLSFVNKPVGIYQVTLANNVGQIVFIKNIQHNGGSATQDLQFEKKLMKGSYQLKVTSKEEVVTMLVLSN